MYRATTTTQTRHRSLSSLLCILLITWSDAWIAGIRQGRGSKFGPRRQPHVEWYQDGSVEDNRRTVVRQAVSKHSILNSLFETEQGPIYFFDGTCNFCNDSVSLCYDLDTKEVIRFAPLQSPTGRAVLEHFGRDPNDRSSLAVLTSPETIHFDSDAVLTIASTVLPERFQGLAKVSRDVIPVSVRNRMYHWASGSRHWFGSVEGPACRVDLDPARFVDQPDAEQ